ncbi:MAG: peptidyl-prolyl cis-trans isomerase [Deltaproteobacteria bacterium]|nr:peptidyl-prolyl cis-trans isomerase [Deltaproteobacteria bacterium]
MAFAAFAACTPADPKTKATPGTGVPTAGDGTSGERANAVPYPRPRVNTEGNVIATLGELQLTDRELEDRMRRESPFVQAQFADPRRKRDFIERQIRMEVLAVEGWRRGLASDPDVQAEFRLAVVKRLMRDELERIGASVKVTDDELHRAYAERQSEFVRPAKVRFSPTVIEVKNEAERKRAQKRIARAQSLPQGAGGKVNPGKVDAGEFLTEDEVRARYGDEAASRLFEASDVGEAVLTNTPNAVILLKKTGFRRGIERTFDSVKSELGAQILAEKKTKAFNDYVGRLEKSLGVVIDETKLEALISPTAGPSPAQAQAQPEAQTQPQRASSSAQ